MILSNTKGMNEMNAGRKQIQLSSINSDQIFIETQQQKRISRTTIYLPAFKCIWLFSICGFPNTQKAKW